MDLVEGRPDEEEEESKAADEAAGEEEDVDEEEAQEGADTVDATGLIDEQDGSGDEEEEGEIGSRLRMRKPTARFEAGASNAKAQRAEQRQTDESPPKRPRAERGEGE